MPVVPFYDHSRDYVGDKAAAIYLTQRIRNYYEAQGIEGIRVEVVPRVLTNSQGDRVSTHWDIRSNLKFDVKQAVAGNVCG